MKKLFTFLLLFSCVAGFKSQCNHTFTMADSYGDGWNGATVDLAVNGTVVLAGVSDQSSNPGGSYTDTVFTAGTGDVISLTNWVSGSYDGEISWQVSDVNGIAIASGVFGDNTVGSGNCATNTGGTCGFFTIELTDSYGDGWNGNGLEVVINGTPTDTLTIGNGNFGSFQIAVNIGDVIDLNYLNTGTWGGENGWNVVDNNGTTIVTVAPTNNGGSAGAGPANTVGIVACPACTAPSGIMSSIISTLYFSPISAKTRFASSLSQTSRSINKFLLTMSSIRLSIFSRSSRLKGSCLAKS